jgi:thioredoxin-dependent peroxiredoxin
VLKPGDPAPDFELPADDGSTVRLSQLRGRRVVLFFYPKDDTPGCTTEACEFRDASPAYEEKNAVILGVSPDSVARHVKFRDKYDLPFRLLADQDHRVAEQYGVWRRKSFMGRMFLGVERTTFLIDEEGRIAEVYEKVKARGHAGDVLGRI